MIRRSFFKGVPAFRKMASDNAGSAMQFVRRQGRVKPMRAGSITPVADAVGKAGAAWNGLCRKGGKRFQGLMDAAFQGMGMYLSAGKDESEPSGKTKAYSQET